MTEVGRLAPVIALQGARRSGKTYAIMQFLITQAYNEGDKCLVASMTEAQGRKGAYDDGQRIIESLGEAFAQYWDILSSPKEYRCKARRRGMVGRISFASFQDPESAKGGAVDWVFINEANKFSWQQYLDLAANARKGVIIDYNPNNRFWVEDLHITPLICHWQDNAQFLTPIQMQYFELLKEKAESPTATSADLYFYRVYYLGEYGEMGGDIFNGGNIDIREAEELPKELHNAVLFGDPSALRGADFFPLVLMAQDAEGDYWVVDCDSTNTGSREERAKVLKEMAAEIDGVSIYIESNGLVGIDFIEFCQNSEIPVNGWCSRGNKFDRIIAEYQNITTRVHFIRHPRLAAFLAQVYDFSKTCEHDDNVDAVASACKVCKFLC